MTRGQTVRRVSLYDILKMNYIYSIGIFYSKSTLSNTQIREEHYTAVYCQRAVSLCQCTVSGCMPLNKNSTQINTLESDLRKEIHKPMPGHKLTKLNSGYHLMFLDKHSDLLFLIQV